MTPERKVIDEMCPSPVARRLRMNRREPVGQARLVRVPDHRRVEQGRRFQRVFLGEVGADQKPAVLAERLVGQQVLADLLEAVQEELAGPLVAAAELPHHLLEQAGRPHPRRGTMTRAMIFSIRVSFVTSNGRMTTRVLFGLRMIPVRLTSMYGDYPRLFAGHQRSDPWALGHYRAWPESARELSSSFISASERRKARVDSAPWFRLIRSS